MPISDVEIVRLIRKTHSFGNTEKEEWLLKLADRKASEIQRLRSFFQDTDKIIQRIVGKVLEKQFMDHFRKHGLNVEKLRNFIRENQWLNLIVADAFDASRSTLRDHLLLTEQILSILLELREDDPFEKNLIVWFESEPVQRKLDARIHPIEKSKGRKTNPELLKTLIDVLKTRSSMRISEVFSRLNSFPKNSISEKLKLIEKTGIASVHNGMISFQHEESVMLLDKKFVECWDEERIALELGITTSEALEVKINMGG